MSYYSDNLFRCPNCPEIVFSTLLEAVRHAERERNRDGSGLVNCCVCFDSDCNIRKHIRKKHPELCTVSCPECSAKFVEDKDCNHHFTSVHRGNYRYPRFQIQDSFMAVANTAGKSLCKWLLKLVTNKLSFVKTKYVNLSPAVLVEIV